MSKKDDDKMIGAGDIVACIHEGPLEVGKVKFKDASRWLKRRQLYRVAGAFVNDHGMSLIVLEGVNPPPPNDGGWIVERFRKVTKADEGFKLMIKMLKGQPKKAKQPTKIKRPTKVDEEA